MLVRAAVSGSLVLPNLASKAVPAARYSSSFPKNRQSSAYPAHASFSGGSTISPLAQANRCVESHLRELIEQGFEVVVVKDATAAPRHPEIGDGYKAALVNYGFIANAVLTTDDAIKTID